MEGHAYRAHRIDSARTPPDESALPLGAIDASFGEPDPTLFPLDILRDAMSAVLTAPLAALQYSPLRGDPDLTAAVADMVRPRVRPSEVVLTNGSIPALLLLAHVLINPGDLIIIEEPGYFRALATLSAYSNNIIPLTHTHAGIDLETLRTQLDALPSQRIFAFVHPTFQNPSGYTWTSEERHLFLDECARHRIVVVEDTAYDALWRVTPPPSLRSLAADYPVIQIGTLSKIVAPGVGVGWIIAPESLASSLVDNRIEFGGVGGLASAAAAKILRDPRFATHVNTVRHAYANRCARFAEGALTIPDLLGWVPPLGGIFAWLPLPQGVTDHQFAAAALSAGVRVLEGSHFFYTQTGPEYYVRLTFGRLAPDLLDESVARLASAYQQVTQR